MLSLIFIALTASPGNAYRSENFTVTSPTPVIAEAVAEKAESLRKSIAKDWLGNKLPRWNEPCAITVKVNQQPVQGSTTFTFGKDKILKQTMTMSGSLDDMLNIELPHEMGHIILAHHLGKPAPRWADEGLAISCEPGQQRYEYDVRCRELLNKGDGVRLSALMKLEKYPKDAMSFHAQSYSLTNYLVDLKDRQTFLAFVDEGIQGGWKKATKHHYGFKNVKALEAAWIESLRQPPKRTENQQ